MSQTLLLVFLQCVLVAVCGAYPYLVVPSTSEPPTRHLVKRAFDRFDNNGIFSFGAKRYDRLDDYEQFSNSNNNRYLFKRDLDDSFDFGFRRKRSFDRIGGSEFGLMKRSVPADYERENIIDNLAESIVALRHSREAENQPILIAYERRRK